MPLPDKGTLILYVAPLTSQPKVYRLGYLEMRPRGSESNRETTKARPLQSALVRCSRDEPVAAPGQISRQFEIQALR